MIISGVSNLYCSIVECEGIPPSWLVAHYMLTGTAEDDIDNFNGSETSATYSYDSERGVVYDGGGSITIPNTSGVSCTYWLDSGAGWVFTYSETIPASLSTNKYSNLACYNKTLSVAEQAYVEGLQEFVHNTPIDNGLIAYYPLDGNSLDNAISPSYDGIDSGVDYVADSTLRWGVCAEFDGTDKITISPTIPLTIAGGYCMSFWATKASNDKILMIADYYTGANYAALFTTDGRINHKSTITHTGNYATTSHGLGDTFSTPHHFIFNRTGTGNNLEFYVDGVMKTTTYNGTLESIDLNIEHIADRDLNDGKKFIGRLSSMRFYNRTLSQAEIDAIYEYEKPCTTVCLDDTIGVGQLP